MTTNQDKGWFGELMAKIFFMSNDNQVSEEKINNKGFDFKAKNIFTGKEIFVESKTNTSKFTKSQKKFKKDCEDNGLNFEEVRTNTYDLFEDFSKPNNSGDYSRDDFSNDLIGVNFNNDKSSVFRGLPD